MKFITVTELAHRTTHIISEIESTGEEVVITKNGKPIVLMRLTSDNEFALKGGEGVKKHGKGNLQKR